MSEIDPKLQQYLIDPSDLDSYLSNFPGSYEQLAKETFWSDKRVLITGISGFVGSHLTDQLLQMEARVYGLVRRHSVPQYSNVRHIIDQIDLYEGNLTDSASVLDIVRKVEPNVIFHLGAQSFVPTSFRNPHETYETNVIGTSNVLEAVRRTETVERVHHACSSEEYGKVYPNEVPIKETNPLRPQSPYAVSKVAHEYAARTHAECYGVPSVITRGFNHTGPRRGLQFVTSVVCRQILRISKEETSRKGVVKLGNPNAIRDFTDVRDMVQGYLLAAEKAKIGEPYNLGSGWGITIGNLVKLAAKIEGVEVKIEIDKDRLRPADVEILICDSTKAQEELGFKIQIPMTKAVEDNIAYYKEPQNLGLIDLEVL